jgi:glycerol-3-phosphate dehydrogenase
MGAEGYPALWNRRHRFARDAGLPVARIEHLLNRYGSLVGELLALMRERPDLGEPIDGATEYLRAEAYYAASHEGALHLDDVLTRRLHVSIETADRGRLAAEGVGELVGDALGWDGSTRAHEVEQYRRSVDAELAAEQQPDDRSADAARRSIGDRPQPGAPANGAAAAARQRDRISTKE